MHGQGCLIYRRQTVAPLRRGAMVAVCPFVFLVLLGIVSPNRVLGQSPPLRSESQIGDAIDAELQLAWQSPQARACEFTVSVNSPSAIFTKVINASQDESSTGALMLSADGKSLSFRSDALTLSGRTRFVFQGPPETPLTVTFRPVVPGAEAIPPTTTTAAQLLAEPLVSTADNSGLQWSIGRIAEDVIRITSDAPTWPLLSAEQSASVFVEIRSLLTAPSQDVSMRYELIRVDDGRTVVAEETKVAIDAFGNGRPIRVDEVAPDQPGVYEIRCRVMTDDSGNLLSRLRGQKRTLMELRRPLIVFAAPGNDAARSSVQSTLKDSIVWQTLATIHPAKHSDWEISQWLPESATRWIPGNGIVKKRQLPSVERAGTPVSVLPPQETYSAKLPHRQGFSPHRITLRVPSGQQIDASVEISNRDDFDLPVQQLILPSQSLDSPHRLLSISETSSSAWDEFSFVHYPRDGDEFIRIVNRSSSQSIEFVSITVASGPEDLTHSSEQATNSGGSLDTGRVAVFRLKGLSWPESITTDTAQRISDQNLHPSTVAMYRYWVASKRVANHAIASGYNAISLPVNDNQRVWFETNSCTPSREQNQYDAYRTACFARWMSEFGLACYVDVSTQIRLTRLEHLRQQGLETNPAASGLLRSGSGRPVAYNLLHPTVRRELERFVMDAVGPIQSETSFAGVILQTDDGNDLSLPAESDAHDFATLQRFAKSGVMQASVLPGGLGSVPTESAGLAAWVQRSGKEVLQQWIRETSYQFYQSIANQLPDHATTILSTRPEGFVQWKRQAGAAAHGRLIAMADRRRHATDPWMGDLNAEPKTVTEKSELTGSLSTAVRLGLCASDSGSPCWQHSESLRHDINQAIRFHDPVMVVVDSSGDLSSIDTEILDLLSWYQQLPVGPMHSMSPTDQKNETVQLRFAYHNNQLLVWICNVTPWQNTMVLHPRADDGNWTRALNEDTPAMSNLQRAELAAQAINAVGRKVDPIVVTLGPSETRVLSLPVDATETGTIVRMPLTRWESPDIDDPSTRAAISSHVAAVIQRIAKLAQPADGGLLSNGGFERSGAVGVPGWMHTQHPLDSVVLDTGEAVEGKQSVRMTTDSQGLGRTWIVSETISPPATGRLAVSLACRGAMRSGDQQHRLRVSIEANQNGRPIRFANEILVPLNGQWQPRTLVLEVSNLDPERVDSLRLTIDSLSHGQVWIDDVHLHDWFPLQNERAELQGKAFLAMQGLQHGDLTHAARLLQNEWARHLINTEPVPPTTQAAPPAQGTNSASEPGDGRSPGASSEQATVAERIKNWLPTPLRF
ncbi:hypothetical protein [Stieleria varia]|uniref:Glycosyl hydrolase-like 10 domain-containing protein n=2 Tax=Stieleria varia TaxID=2528005 RepID=A0A5C6B3K9_9BACT|nr:hypothetical protein [Stieleria varia]TWU06122.1 hypothetical protein Pla52n_18420 [Stieleria varia]